MDKFLDRSERMKYKEILIEDPIDTQVPMNKDYLKYKNEIKQF